MTRVPTNTLLILTHSQMQRSCGPHINAETLRRHADVLTSILSLTYTVSMGFNPGSQRMTQKAVTPCFPQKHKHGTAGAASLCTQNSHNSGESILCVLLD